MNSIVLTISGPSGAGKSFLEKSLTKRGFGKVISTTTRLPRPGEVDGVDYHFVNRDIFELRWENGQFVEHTEFKGNSYGVHSDDLTQHFDAGNPAVIVAEPHGVAQIQDYCKDHDINCISVFLRNHPEVLIERYLRRLDAESLEAERAYHAARIVNIFEEMKWAGLNLWDVVFDRYGPDNSALVEGSILRWLQSVGWRAA